MIRSRLGRAALFYAEALSLPVFPLAPRGKLPLIAKRCGGRGFKDATTERAQISEWWSRHPEANIGLALGEIAGGIFAVDVDPRSEGDANWAWLRSQHGGVPTTVESVTGGGGQHILLRGNVPCSVLEQGVDIKASGGYIVVPPSIHPNGHPYCWDALSRPDEVEIADAPDWLLALLGRRRHVEYFTYESSIDPETFTLGAAFKAAGWLGRELRPGVWAARCPNETQHTTGESLDSSTVIFAPEPGRYRGRFYCSHAHCREVYR